MSKQLRNVKHLQKLTRSQSEENKTTSTTL